MGSVRFNHDALLAARLGLGLTQEETAAALAVDIRTYRRYESGEVNRGRRGFAVRNASRSGMIERIVSELGISVQQLLIPSAVSQAGVTESEYSHIRGASLTSSPSESAHLAAPKAEARESVRILGSRLAFLKAFAQVERSVRVLATRLGSSEHEGVRNLLGHLAERGIAGSMFMNTFLRLRVARDELLIGRRELVPLEAIELVEAADSLVGAIKIFGIDRRRVGPPSG
jgi:transcriptional regulator with XRE-family HTH domain